MNVKGWNWLKVGILMGLLDVGFLLFYGKLLGASTAYVSITGGILKYITPNIVTINAYLKETSLGFTREVALMVGVAAGAFIGGILVILGARLAGGCTSGHVLSGWSSSWNRHGYCRILSGNCCSKCRCK